jgi:hypothetical protein
LENKDFEYEITDPIDPRFIPVPYPSEVQKHQEHDQKTHGSWATLTNTTFGDYKMTFEYQPSNELSLHFIHAYDQNKKQVGQLRWDSYTGTVNSISVEPEHQRKGIATAMWDWATKLSKTPAKDFPENIKHGWGIQNPRHDNFIVTPQGKSWVESLQKHEGGGHDQSTHGSWANGSSESGLDAMPYEWKPKLSKSNMTDEQYAKNAETLKSIAEAPVSTYLYGMELDLIVKEGRFKSLSEIPTANENLVMASEEYRQGRSDLENGLWGVPKTGVQPIYGYMDTNYGDHKPATIVYGDVKVTLKDNVSGRTTFSAGDSLNSTLIPVKVSDARAGTLSKSEIEASFTSQKKETYFVQSELRSPDRIGYFEAQVHGGISIKDIKTVTISQYARVAQSTQDTLKSLGVEVIRLNDNR